MIIGTLREIKNNENRVGITPHGVSELVKRGNRVLVQETAGIGSGYKDSDYLEVGAEIVRNPAELVAMVDLLVKVKEPVREEYHLLDLMKGKTLFTYFHLSGVQKSLTNRLLDNEITAIAYETVEDGKGQLPLLAPMSEVAGILAIQYAAQYLQKKYDGRGITMGHIPGTELARTVIVGGGVAGEFAARAGLGLGSVVTIFELRDERIKELRHLFDELFGVHISKNLEILKPIEPIYSEKIAQADVLIGAVLTKGTRAPEVVNEAQIRSMPRGAVVIDISIDQGGCIWGSRPTTHEDPIYDVYGKIYCSVANMPGQVARQSTQALTSATLPYILKLAEKGVIEALTESYNKEGGRFARGLNTFKGKITYEAVAKDLALDEFYEDGKKLLGV